MSGGFLSAPSARQPARFPVCPQDNRRSWARRMLALLIATSLLAPLFPKVAGPTSALAVPVRYARLELTARSPVVIELDLPAADYAVAPVSLGYFTGANRFVYTAEVARGLIYGRSGEYAVVVELWAPRRSALFIDEQLSEIRGKVETLNERENMLRLAREPLQRKDASLDQRVISLWEALAPDLTGPLSADWLDRVVERHGEELTAVHAALLDDARNWARLKRLYYESQSARLELMLSQFDLQLALAHLPHPEIAELDSLGDQQVVQQTMLSEVDRLRRAWSERSDELNRQIAADRQWLERTCRRQVLAPLDPLSTVFGPRPYYETAPPEPPPGVMEARVELELSLIQARLVVAVAELEQLEMGLRHLGDVRSHVLAGGLPSWADLPRIELAASDLREPRLDSLNLAETIEQEATDPTAATHLLLDLACAFERDGDSPAGARPAVSALGGIEPYPHEVPYGLLVVDRCVRRGSDRDTSPETDDPEPAPSLVGLTAAVLAFPDEYGVAAFELGYLKFMRWYAALPYPQAGDVQRPDADYGAPAEVPAGAGTEPKLQEPRSSGADPGGPGRES